MKTILLPKDIIIEEFKRTGLSELEKNLSFPGMPKMCIIDIEWTDDGFLVHFESESNSNPEQG